MMNNKEANTQNRSLAKTGIVFPEKAPVRTAWKPV